jgi:hypothetical protein
LGCDDGFFLKASESSSGKSVRESAITINVIEAIESFASSHAEKIEEILNWPWKKFEALYEAHTKREQSEKALDERNAYITGLLANTNLDDGKSTKRNMLENVDIDYQNALKSIYNIVNKDEIDFDQDPFFKAIKIPGAEIPVEATESEPTTEVNKNDIDTDQGGI